MVVADTATEDVNAVAVEQGVDVAVGLQAVAVAAGAAFQIIRPALAFEGVVTSSAVEVVVISVPCDEIISGTRDESQAVFCSKLSSYRRHPFKLILNGCLRLAHFILVLQSHPELNGCAEYFAEAKGGIRSNAALSQNNFIDTTGWNPNRMCEFGLAYFHRMQKLFKEYFTRMNIFKLIHELSP
jgi:hypothetical protein